MPDDKITRWHPKFSLDEVPDIPEDSLPEAPYVKKYQSAKDVLEDNQATLPDRVSVRERERVIPFTHDIVVKGSFVVRSFM